MWVTVNWNAVLPFSLKILPNQEVRDNVQHTSGHEMIFNPEASLGQQVQSLIPQQGSHVLAIVASVAYIQYLLAYKATAIKIFN